MKWFWACWYNVRNDKSYFNDFWVDMVKNGHVHLAHETLKLNWFFACWLWCNNFWLNHHFTLYVWLLNTSLMHLNLLDPWREQEESYDLGSVGLFPSWHLFECFLWIGSLVIIFLEFSHGARNPYEVVHGNQVLWKNFFCPRNWANGPNLGQTGFF